MTKQELHIVLKLNLIFSLRMLGIFMILPVLTIFATSLQAANNYLIGIAIGIYGLMQIIFQLPFGIISDKIGHKYIIIIGLIIFVIGGEIAALTNNIWGLIIGRALQGTGAISSSLITLLLHSVQKQNRIQAMAIMGINFGITFASSIILGPIITNIFGFQGLLQSIVLLGMIAVILTCFITSTPTMIHNHYDNKNYINLSTILNDLKKILINKQLMKLNISIFCLHTILMYNFIVLPKIMIHLKFTSNMHWKIYGIIMIISACIVLPCLFCFKTKYFAQQTLIICTNILLLSELIMLITNMHYRWIFLLGMQLFFITFNLMETILPYLVSNESSQKYKSTTISIYSIGQFLGIGFGGITGGFLLEIQGIPIVLFSALIISILLIIMSNTLKITSS